MPLLKKNIVSNNRYLVRFAQSPADVKAAQRLRYQIFNLELGEGLEQSEEYGLDEDKYDAQCHHLLVIHKATNDVIATYRMQTYEIAQKSEGFYTSEEFDLKPIPNEILNNSVEVGRACIAGEHRNGRVLFLLWRGIAQYLMYMNCNYLFGCCSLTSQSAAEAWSVMAYLKEKNYLHDTLWAPTMEDYSCDEVDSAKYDTEGTTLPQLFRLYMDLGAKVCSPPAIDRAFKTIDYLVILDINNLDERTKMLFFN